MLVMSLMLLIFDQVRFISVNHLLLIHYYWGCLGLWLLIQYKFDTNLRISYLPLIKYHHMHMVLSFHVLFYIHSLLINMYDRMHHFVFILFNRILNATIFKNEITYFILCKFVLAFNMNNFETEKEILL